MPDLNNTCSAWGNNKVVHTSGHLKYPKHNLNATSLTFSCRRQARPIYQTPCTRTQTKYTNNLCRDEADASGRQRGMGVVLASRLLNQGSHKVVEMYKCWFKAQETHALRELLKHTGYFHALHTVFFESSKATLVLSFPIATTIMHSMLPTSFPNGLRDLLTHTLTSTPLPPSASGDTALPSCTLTHLNLAHLSIQHPNPVITTGPDLPYAIVLCALDILEFLDRYQVQLTACLNVLIDNQIQATCPGMWDAQMLPELRMCCSSKWSHAWCA
ncbi:hypothetical protein K439DRAFT_1619083 [Ramaria rubella]|nr:hypothetical protein K439DRAFT_1619083 [Ramaria rubella]